MFEEIRKKACYYFSRSTFAVKTLIRWLVISVGIGLLVGTISSLFGHALVLVTEFRKQYPMIICGLPIAGLLIVFLLSQTSHHKTSLCVLFTLLCHMFYVHVSLCFCQVKFLEVKLLRL